jgi:hypothetical protein
MQMMPMSSCSQRYGLTLVCEDPVIDISIPWLVASVGGLRSPHGGLL